MSHGAGEDAETAGTLSDSEQFAHATFDALAEHVAVLDERGTVLTVNQAWREFAGANSSSLEGLAEGANYFAACASATGAGAAGAARFAAGLRAVIGGSLDEFSLEYPCHSPTRRRWFIARATRFELGGEVRAVVTHTNITERKLAEERLRESEERYRAIVSQAMAGVAHVDLSGRFTVVNEKYCDITGYSESELLGMRMQEITHPDDLPVNARLFGLLVADGTPFEIEKRYVRKDGSVIWVHLSASVILDHDGRPQSSVAVVLDVTGRRRMEMLLDAQKQALEMVAAGSPLTEVLTYMAQTVERQAEGQAVASILLLDEQGRLCNGASPSLPDEYLEAIDGIEADPGVGTCSSAAARGMVVVTPDIASDPKWRGLAHLPLGLGLRAAWSMPITARDGRVLGTFGTYFRERRGPEAMERQTVEILAHTAALAVERGLAEQRLTRSEEQLRAIFEASRDGILVEDGETIFYANRAYAQMLGYDDPEELRGRPVSSVVSTGDAGRLLEYGRRRLAGETPPAVYEFKGRRKDGGLIDLEASVSTHSVAGTTYITTAVRDISERRQAEEALRRSESKYRLLMGQASDGIYIYDRRGNIIETNSKLCELLGYNREELLRLNVKDIIAPEDLAATPVRFDELQKGQTLLTERRLRRKDGTLLPVEISKGKIRGGVMQAIVRDISERKRAEAELREAYDQLERRVEERTGELARANAELKVEIAERVRAEEAGKELMLRLVTAQEEERQRISRELHDEMGQQLVALLMGLRMLNDSSYGRQATLDTLRQLLEITEQLSRETHTLAWGLRPAALDDLGLEAALSGYIEEWAKRSRVTADFHSAGFEGERLPLTHETALYRIAQEALTNVAKHSGADHVSFILERRGDRVLAVIEDNGEGFDVESLTETSVRERRLGLLGMRERAAMLGGTVTVESAVGAGTSVFVRIPVGSRGDEGGSTRG